MINNLRIHKKGTVLIAVPLIFEIVFFLLVLFFIGQAESSTVEEAKSRALIQEASEISISLYELGNFLAGAYFSSDKSKLFSEFRKRSDRVDQHCRNLKKLVRDKPAQRKHVEKMLAYKQEISDVLFGMGMRGMMTGKKVGTVQMYRKQMGRSYSPLLEEVKIIIDSEKKTLDKKVRETKKLNSYARGTLTLALAGSILLTLVLARLFSTSITWRLRLLEDNVQRFKNGEDLNVDLSGSDEIKIVDQAFHSMAREVRELERSKQEFLSMISHDMRSPLTALQGTLAVAASGSYGDINEYGLTRLANAERNVDRLIGLISDLLDIERLEAGSIELSCKKHDIESIVEDAMVSLTAVAEARSITLTNSCEPYDVTLDRQRVEQVLINLLTNAIKFSSDGQEVTVSSDTSDEWLTVRVSDCGRGIPEEELDTIFDRFSQVEEEDAEAGKGYGLGLAICKLLVEAHGGDMGVESTAGKGSTFWFRLPISWPDRSV